MFGMGMPELLLILVVALVVVGPKKLPDLAKSLGKGMRQFRDATEEIKGEFADNDTFKDVMEVKNSFKDTVDSLNPRGLLDVEPAIEPKKPDTDYSGRQELFQDIADETLAAQTVEETEEHLSAEVAPEDTPAEQPPAPATEATAEPLNPPSNADQDA